MDNLTHTLIGVAAAHSLPKRLRTPESYWAFVIGNNLPDADFIYSLLPGSDSLGYLVHHRGYTHSVFLAFFLALIGTGLVRLIVRQPIHARVYGWTLLACWMHIGADFMNNYGVHPFTPFSNRWFYGDSIFIVEPLLWLALIPLAFFLAKRRLARGFWFAVGLAAVGLVILHPLVAFPVKIASLLVAIASILAHRQWVTHGRVGLAWILSVGVVFAFASQTAQSRVRESLARRASGENIRDIDATPFPGNPFCWHSWTLTESTEKFHLRSVATTLWPAIYSSERCEANEKVAPQHANVEKAPNGSGPRTGRERWLFTHEISKAQIADLEARSCRLQRLMTFLRFPFLKPAGDNAWLVGDLRYDQRAGGNFTMIQLEPSAARENCEAGNAPWESPFHRGD